MKPVRHYTMKNKKGLMGKLIILLLAVVGAYVLLKKYGII